MKRLSIPADATFEPADKMTAKMKGRVIGQDEALKVIASAFHRVWAGLKTKKRPVSAILFVGPTGVGKTLTAQAVAETFVGGKLVKVDCGDFAGDQKHNITRIKGAGPTWIGHDTTAIFSKENFGEGFVTVLLLDEVEKALDTRDEGNAFQGLLVSILESGQIQNSRNEWIPLWNTIIVMTGNIGTKQIMRDVVGEHAMGFRKRDGNGKLTHNQMSEMTDEEIEAINGKIETLVKKEVKKRFRPEVFNRFKKIVVFRYLTSKESLAIVGIEIAELQKLLLDSGKPIILQVTDPAKKFILDHTSHEREYGARALGRVVETLLTDPLAEFINYGQIKPNTVVKVTVEADQLVFWSDDPPPGMLIPQPALTAGPKKKERKGDD